MVEIEVDAHSKGRTLVISPLLAEGVGDCWPPGAVINWTVADPSVGQILQPRIVVKSSVDGLGGTTFLPQSPGTTNVQAAVSLKDGRTFNAVALVTVLPGPKPPGPEILGSQIGTE